MRMEGSSLAGASLLLTRAMTKNILVYGIIGLINDSWFEKMLKHEIAHKPNWSTSIARSRGY